MQEVLKTFWRRLSRDILARCLEDILKTILQGVLKTSWRRLEDVLKTFWRRMTKTNILVLIKTSWRRLLKTYDYGEYIHLDQDVLKTSSEDEEKRRLQDVFIKTNVCWGLTQQILVGLQNMSWRSLQLQRNNFLSSKTSWRLFEGVLKTCFEDVLKTSLEDVLKTCLRDKQNV